MTSFIKTMINALIFLAVIYFGLMALLALPQYQYEQAEKTYQAIFVQPQNQAQDFESWLDTLNKAIETDRQRDWIKQYSVYLLFPALRQQFSEYYQSSIDAREKYQQIANALQTNLKDNNSLKRSWELAVLADPVAKSLPMGRWGEDLFRLLNSPTQSSQALLDFAKFNQQKKLLEKKLSIIEQQLHSNKSAFLS